ncbi:MAG: purine-nucleoside phosphorylase [Verrucomicrobiota bacterium]
MSTPHISANPGDFAETVLMPGDPLRAKHIADTFFENAEQVTAVRNMFGYTGTYKNLRVSVMGSGMGIPSISIYAHELFTTFDVKNIIRVGSCGAVLPDVKLRDVVIGAVASTDSAVNLTRFNDLNYKPAADPTLLQNAVTAADHLNIETRVGEIFSADLFYNPNDDAFDPLEARGVLGIEMEAAGLYGCADLNKKHALAICTVSDHIRTGEHLPPADRETTFNEMIQITLDSLLLPSSS